MLVCHRAMDQDTREFCTNSTLLYSQHTLHANASRSRQRLPYTPCRSFTCRWARVSAPWSFLSKFRTIHKPHTFSCWLPCPCGMHAHAPMSLRDNDVVVGPSVQRVRRARCLSASRAIAPATILSLEGKTEERHKNAAGPQRLRQAVDACTILVVEGNVVEKPQQQQHCTTELHVEGAVRALPLADGRKLILPLHGFVIVKSSRAWRRLTRGA